MGLQLSALGVALALMGCAGAPKPLTSLDGVREGTTTLRVRNNVVAGELERLSIDVDGEPLPLSALPPAGGDPATVGSLRLSPGAHSIAVRATARRAGGEVIVVGAHEPFLIERGASAIGVDVRSATDAGPLGASAPVAVNLTMRGGRLSPALGAPPPDGKDQHCAGLLPIPRALCRAAFDLDEANRHSDVVTSLCLRDKLAELRRLAVIGESGRAENVALAEARATALSRLAERCVGDVVASPAPDGVTVTRAGSP
jgi:hypothetical protein